MKISSGSFVALASLAISCDVDTEVVRVWRDHSALPAPVQEHAVAAVSDKVVVLGGLGPTGNPTSRVVAFDPQTSTWTALASLPSPLHHLNVTVIDGVLWVVGGLEAFKPSGATLSYDATADAWTAHASMPAGTERGSSFVGAVDGVIYVAGGFRGGLPVVDCSAYDTKRDVWGTCPPLPEARDHGMSAVVSGTLYAIGGKNGTHAPSVVAFDPKKPERGWFPRASMPTSRAGGVAAVLGTIVVVAGGEGNTSVPSGVFDVTEAYDPVTNTWWALAPMRTPRHGTGAAVVNDKMYVPGGGTLQGLGPSAVVESLGY